MLFSGAGVEGGGNEPLVRGVVYWGEFFLVEGGMSKFLASGGTPPHPPSWENPVTIFILISYSLYPQIMLILILINIQCLQKVVFSFEKDVIDG